MGKVYILVGASGSGKSTWARQQRGAVVVSADAFFERLDGSYAFDAAKLGEAHAACLRSFVEALSGHWVGDVIVDNTNTTLVEIAPYYALARAYGYEVEIVMFANNHGTTHGVPPAAIEAQRKRVVATLASIPPFWEIKAQWGDQKRVKPEPGSVVPGSDPGTR